MRPPHPATLVQPRAAPSGPAPKPPHPATLVQPRAAPHPATLVQPRAAPSGPAPKPPHPATLVQPRAAPGGIAPRPPHPATLLQPKAHPAMSPWSAPSSPGGAAQRATESKAKKASGLFFYSSENVGAVGVMKEKGYACVAATDDADGLLTAAGGLAPLAGLVIATHGDENGFLLVDGTDADSPGVGSGEHDTDPATMGAALGRLLGEGAEIFLCSCNVAQTDTVITALATSSGHTVYAPTRYCHFGASSVAVQVTTADEKGSKKGVWRIATADGNVADKAKRPSYQIDLPKLK